MDEKEEHVMGLIHTNLFVFLRKETRDFKQSFVCATDCEQRKTGRSTGTENWVLNMQVQVLNLCTQYTYFLKVLHFKNFQ